MNKFIKSVLIGILSISIIPISQARELDHKWSRFMGLDLTNDVKITAAAVDNDGNSIIAGYAKGPLNISGGTANDLKTENGTHFIAKLNKDGGKEWVYEISLDNIPTATQWVATVANSITSIATDKRGYVYIGGFWRNRTVDFNADEKVENTLTAESSLNDGFLLKVDKNGKFISVRKFDGVGGFGWCQVQNVEVDTLGNCYVAGVMRDEVNFDPTNGTNFKFINDFTTDIFLLKIDASNTVKWVKLLERHTSTGVDQLRDLKLDKQGNAYVLGYMSNASSIIRKFDPDGSLIWKLGWVNQQTNNMVVQKMTIDEEGACYVIGEFNNTVKFDTSVWAGTPQNQLTALGTGSDIFVMKFDGAAKFQWVKHIGGTLADVAASISYNNGFLFIHGYYVGADNNQGFKTGMDPASSTGRGMTKFICQLNKSTGGVTQVNYIDHKWTLTSVSATNLTPYQAIVKNNEVYLLGIFNDTMRTDIDKANLVEWTSKGTQRNFYLMKYAIQTCKSQNITIKATYDTACLTYTHNGQIFTKSQILRDTFKNMDGCDSAVMELNLTIYEMDTTEMSVTACDSFRSPSDKYTWNTSGVYVDTLKNEYGCETKIMLVDLVISEPVVDSIVEKACKSYISPSGKNAWTESGMYTDTLSSATGCDSSIVHIDLTIINLDKRLELVDGTLRALESTSEYRWWDCRGMTMIEGEKGQTFTPTKSGVYAVVLIKEICSEISDCIEVKVTSTSDLNVAKHLISVSPNPGQGVYDLRFSNKTEGQKLIKVINSLGRVVYQDVFEGESYKLDIQNQSSGLYYLSISTADRTSFYSFSVIKL